MEVGGTRLPHPSLQTLNSLFSAIFMLPRRQPEAPRHSAGKLQKSSRENKWAY